MGSNEAALAAWLQEFTERALRPSEVDGFVRAVDDEILAAIPELAGDPALVEDLHASTRAHWRTFLVSLADEFQLALPPAAVGLSLSIARRHLDINVLLKVYRVANKSTFGYLTAHTAVDTLPPGLPRDEALIHLWLRAERWIDESIEQLIEHYTRERASLAEGVMARRAETIEALVGGAVSSAEAERLLGHPLSLWQTAFVLFAPPTGEPDLPLFDVAVRMCQRLGLPRPLTTLAGSRELWGWVATPEEPALPLEDAAELLGSSGLQVAFGRPCRGETSFRTSHLQAVAAQRVGLPLPTPCHAYGDVELVSLVGDGELARELVLREAGPLLGRSKGSTAIRETVLVYLRTGQSVDTTAQQLFVHPNTVRYRIGRAEEQLGRRIADRGAALEVALGWVEVYGADAVG